MPTFEPHLAERLGCFAILRNVIDFRVNGGVSIDLKLNVEKLVSQAPAPIGSLLNEILMMQDKGRGLYNAGKWASAIVAFHGTLKKLDHYAHRWRYLPIQIGRYPWETYEWASFDVRLGVQQGLILSHSRLEEWKDAHFWAAITINVAPVGLKGDFWGKVNRRSYVLVLFERAFILRKRGKTEKMARYVAAAVSLGHEIRMPETQRMETAIMGTDDGNLMAHFEAMKPV